MLKAILIDDESSVRADLQSKIEKHFAHQITIVGEADSVASGILAITTHEPDLVFLDVNLQDGTGFDIIQGTDYKNFEIIFVTGYDEHAIKAIKVGALDYVLKPVDLDELSEAVAKAIENSDENSQLEKLIEISNEYFHGSKRKRVIFKTAENVYAVYEEDILYCSSDGNYTTIYTTRSEKILISKPIKKVEEILTENIFIRCHQSYIVNSAHVIKYSKQGYLVLSDQVQVPVSSRRKDYVLSKIFK
ncbi:MAG: LytTR family DNA-binding domain-containing protein [Bacteroidota bacterium]